MVVSSSIRYKADIRPLEDVIPKRATTGDVIDQLKPIIYRSLGEKDDPEQKFIGFVAEDVAKIVPELVSWREVDNLDFDGAAPETRKKLPTPVGYASMADYIEKNVVGGKVPEHVQYDRLVPFLVAELQQVRLRLKALEIVAEPLPSKRGSK